MKLLMFITLAVVALTYTLAVPLEHIQKAVRQDSSLITEAERDDLRRILAVQGCNANVCFAIDGSRSISGPEFEAQKNFVLDVISIITVDEAAELAAVQYGLASSAISPLTSDVGLFIQRVNAEPQLLAPETFLVAGVNYCFGELLSRPTEAKKMVILGDGRSTIGASAIDRTDLFRQVTKGSVCAVGVGFGDDVQQLLGIAGGDPDQVFTATNFLDTFNLRNVLRALVARICNADLS